MPVVAFDHYDRTLALSVVAPVGNSIATSDRGRRRTIAWKGAVGTAVKLARGSAPWAPDDHYVISLGFSFHLPSHGNQPLDVENFIKPTLDALAAGLFCALEEDVASLARWGFDDSNFRHLFIHRLPDAATAQEEGVGLFVCGASDRRDRPPRDHADG